MVLHTTFSRPFRLAAVLLGVLGIASADPACRAISANVVALDQAFYVNRMGALQTGGMIFALRSDVVSTDGSATLQPGKVMLRADKRPRPMVLRMDMEDCLTVHFQNLLTPGLAVITGPKNPPPVPVTGPGYGPNATMQPTTNSTQGSDQYLRSQPATRMAGVHATGLQLVKATPVQAGIVSDASYAGTNDNSLVSPGGSIDYTFYAEAEGAYLLYSTGADVGAAFGFGGQLSQGLFGSVTVQPKGAEWYRSQVTNCQLQLAAKTHTADDRPLIDYGAKYPTGTECGAHFLPGTPVLKMLNDQNQIVYTDLTAIITGPNAGLLPPDNSNPSYPQREKPYREFVIHYHDDFDVAQAFPEFTAKSGTFAIDMFPTMSAGRDFFAINYGIAGIGPEVWANRLGVGPMGKCATCRFEEFFLSSWSVGDPAMVVDYPANSIDPSIPAPSPSDANQDKQIKLGPKATKAYFPDDPSNVYHSYLSDNTKFRILHAGTNVTHVHHQHAHQWLHSPNSDESHYRDSQMISPGAGYTLDYVYWGSGNKNLTVGDSIFHCHFYPHFAQGMWSLWRVHDVFEEGTLLDKNGRPDVSLPWNRALPDGEILAGTPTPAIVPMPEYAMAPKPAGVKICPVGSQTDFVQYAGTACPKLLPGTAIGRRALVNEADLKAGMNPGYPFFVPGLAGQRAPAPPLDFAKEGSDLLDGGLPRHVVMAELGKPCTPAQISAHPNLTDDPGCVYEKHNQWDFSKFNEKLLAVEVDEDGTDVEKTAMKYHETRKHPSFTPGGVPRDFLTNGQPRERGAPYANPAVKLDGNPVPPEKKIVYKAADIQTNVVLNKKGWHYPQQRLLSLWGDVKDTLANKKRPEPLFFRVNSGDVVEYWQANLVPNYYELDDFQVRTPTDILGQHIHLVKFDVTSSDGAANGYNYEDGTLSPDEVREVIHAIDNNSGIWSRDAGHQIQLTAKEIPFFGPGPNNAWVGAQATIQRWYADPLLDKACEAGPPADCHDRTMQTVFTHDHFGPSTHQQIGLYAGLVIEPEGSKWLNAETGTPLGGRDDGGPTSWQAIVNPPKDGPGAGVPYREFLLEFQDRQLAYTANSPAKAVPYTRNNFTIEQINCFFAFAANPTACNPLPPALKPWGWSSWQTAVNKPFPLGPNAAFSNVTRPKLITNQVTEGTYSLNYSSEPLPYRVAKVGASPTPQMLDLAHAFQSIPRSDPLLNRQPPNTTPIDPAQPAGFKFPPPQDGAELVDPYTPLLRAYEGEHVQIRNLVGAHMLPHSFTVNGLKWLFEPAFTDSGYRSTQGMSLSEHYELLFQLPNTAAASPQADYLYAPTSDPNGLIGGNWGILRAYKQPQPHLYQIPYQSAPQGTAACATPNRTFDVTAVFARQMLGGPILYNSRGIAGQPGVAQIQDWNGLVYVRTSDLDSTGKLKPGVPVEPLILRANAGDCMEITLRNTLLPVGTPMNAGRTVQMLGRSSAQNVNINTSHEVGLHAQLVSYDVTQANGVNVGLNPPTTITPGQTTTFRWYAGSMEPDSMGKVVPKPMELGAINLSPADPLMQHPYGMVGGLIVEPLGSTWKEDSNSRASATVTKQDGTKFREFVAVFHDDLAALRYANTISLEAFIGTAGPQWMVNGKPVPNGNTITLNEGDTVAVAVQQAFHGLTFLTQSDAQSAFNFVGGIAFVNQPNFCVAPQPLCPTAWGTPGQAAGKNGPTLLAVLQVKPFSEIPAGLTSIAFECTVHKLHMAGSFQLNRTSSTKTSAVAAPPSTIPSGVTTAVNYRTEPFAYRYVDPAWSDNTNQEAGTGGMMQVLSDSLVGADPQTPVFAAAKGIPVRMRMLHPAGTAEETITLHGHFWQEEPYTNNSTEMGNNPKSQATGSRDTFGANASFDILLNHAGGAFETPGDYLYRTFIGDDVMQGMWGLLRVGEPMQDIVKVIRFEQAAAACGTGGADCVIVSGVNSVNTDTGEMAKQVTISAVQGSTESPLGTAPVDPLSGAWQLQVSVATVPTSVKVVSDGGGSAATGQVTSQPGNAAVTRLLNQRRAAKQQDKQIIDDFRPPVFNEADNPAAAPPPRTTPKPPAKPASK